MIVCKRFSFEAAHKLPHHRGKCKRKHGHSYKVVVCIAGDVQEEHHKNPESGMVKDFSFLNGIMSDYLRNYFDHHTLNAIIENPTAERVVEWFVSGLQTKMPAGIRLARIQVWETEDSFAEWNNIHAI